MALPLPTELLSQQTAKVRKPIIEVTAGRLTADFPLLGNAIANPDSNEQDVSASLFMSDGRYVMLYAGQYVDAPYDELLQQLRMIITDADVTEFNNYVAVYSDTSRQIKYLDTIAIDSSTIGVVAQLGDDYLGLFTVSDAGVKLTETKLTGLATLHGAAIVATDSGYALIYIQQSGSTYTIYRRTSTDFVNWSSATAITISGLDSSHQVQHPRMIRLADSSYLLIYSYATVQTTDTTVFNIQYSTSTDLSSWSAAAAITSTSEVNTDYVYPDVIQKPDGSLFIATQESNSYLELTTTSPGWNTTDEIGPTNVWVDSAEGKAYLTTIYSSVGTKRFYGSAKIDIDTWTIEAFYDENTVPAVPAPLIGVQCLPADRNYISDAKATIHTYTFGAAAVIDFDADVITGYYLRDMSSYGESYAQNVAGVDALDDFITKSIYYTKFSTVADNKLWLLVEYVYSVYWTKLAVCALDLDAVTPPYELEVVATATISGDGQPMNHEACQVYPAQQLALYGARNLNSYEGCMVVLDLATGGVLKHYHVGVYQDFPFSGVTQVVLVGDTVWAIPAYDADEAPASDDHKWGLMSIDLNTDAINYYHPDWAGSAEVYFSALTVNEADSELILGRSDGVAVFNYLSKVWEQLTNDVVEGLPPTNPDPSSTAPGVAYDPTRRVFIYGSLDHVYLVPRGGKIKSLEYITDSGDFVFSEPATLAYGYTDARPSLALTGYTAYVSWTETGDETINWGREDARLDLGQYLVAGREIKWTKSVDASGTLSFEVSHGHLFDQENDNSLLRPYLARGRGVQVRCGETVNGVDWLVDQGTFLIDSVSVGYKTGEYPVLSVGCKDISSLWDDNQITVASVSGKTPEQALPPLVTMASDMSESDVVVPSMPLSFSFDANWLESEKRTIIEDVAHRFQHFPYVAVDNTVEFRPFDFASDPVNAWTDGIEFLPGDDFSDLTNRVTVTGISDTDFQVTYEEQPVGSVNGTAHWAGMNKDYTVWYSDDHEMIVKNPRLEVIESATPIMFELAGKLTEGISEVDPYNKYCVVEVKAPSLIPMLAAAIATYATGNILGDLTVSVGGGKTIPLGRKIEGVGLMAAMMVLGSIANFQYEVWGNPVGYTKRSYSASTDDDELQQELGVVKRQQYEGFLCSSQAHCQTVADFMLMLLKLARRPLTVKKPAHLQDEPGDLVTARHPYTGVDKKVFIRELARSYLQPAAGDSNGGVIDTVKGWVVS